MSAADRYSCDEVEDLLPLVAEGAIEAADDPALFDHLAVCADCQTSLAEHDLVSLALGAEPPAPAPTPIAFVRLPLAAAALWFLALGGLGSLAWYASQPAANETQPASTEVVGERFDPTQGRTFLLRTGTTVEEVPAQDGFGEEKAANGDDQHRPMPVSNRRR